MVAHDATVEDFEWAVYTRAVRERQDTTSADAEQRRCRRPQMEIDVDEA